MTENGLTLGTSMIHGLDPKIRILSGAFLSITAAVCDNLTVAWGYLAAGLLVCFLAELSPAVLWKRLRPLILFLIMIWLFLPLTFGGEPLAAVYGIPLSADGILLSAKISIKSVAILLLFTALFATIPMASLGNGLQQLRVPDKLVFLFLMSYRYIAVIEDEYNRLLRAARFRGFKPGTNLHSYRTFAYLAGMLFVRASFRAKRVHQAMRCRGFTDKFHTLDVYPPLRLNPVFLGCAILAGTALQLTELFWTFP